MSMREKMIGILLGPGAMCRMSREEASDIIDDLIDTLMNPTEEMLKCEGVPLGGYGFGDDCYAADPEEVFKAIMKNVKDGR